MSGSLRRKVDKNAYPTNEELRQAVIHIIRTAPSKEMAAASIVHMLIERVMKPIKSETARLHSELRENIRRSNEKMNQDFEALKAKISREMKEMEAEALDDDGDEWKKGDKG